ncbi:exodeoxyribonuclease VII large subunit [Spiroplasma endosymbiont of Amphibalanus improvisus]|uniref:exodeoxyribonuclease VII large subunit n=1 Tax=Spiroplasma endosymbiont of Amphibalanus improvisus TaxID=3066327 RepID=UPI00313F2DED
MSVQTTISVTELNSYIKNHLENDSYLLNISVQGEVSNLTLHKSGHCYLTLKDNTSEIKAIIFSFNNKSSNYKPNVGDKVVAKGKINLYVQRGTYNLSIIEIQQAGLGEAYLELQKLKAKLEKAGWFKPEFKQPLPKFPKNIGVVTSPTGAAIQDILKTTKKRYPLANIYLFPSKVQGIGASEDCAKQIEIANHFKETKLDVLIVGRGGGSIEDLWAFNELPVLEAIHESRIPVVSAVGHEIDHLLSDEVADSFAHTPTAAAEIITPDLSELWRSNKQSQVKIINLIKNLVDKNKNEIINFKENYHLKNLDWIYQEKEKELGNFKNLLNNQLVSFKTKLKNDQTWNKQNQKTIKTCIQNQLSKRFNQVGQYQQFLINFLNNYKGNLEKISKANKQQQKLLCTLMDNLLKYYQQINNNLHNSFKLLDHKNVLKRGFSIMYIDDKPIDSIKKVTINQKVKIEMYDGHSIATINEVKNTK